MDWGWARPRGNMTTGALLARFPNNWIDHRALNGNGSRARGHSSWSQENFGALSVHRGAPLSVKAPWWRGGTPGGV